MVRLNLENYLRFRRAEDGAGGGGGGGESQPSRHSRPLRQTSLAGGDDWWQALPTADIRARIDAYRQRYLLNPAVDLADSKILLTDAIKYLERVRFAEADEESWLMSLASRILCQLSSQLPLPTDGLEDIVVNCDNIPALQPSSWLRVGSIFEGTQHAAVLPSAHRRRLLSNSGNENNPIHYAAATTTAHNIAGTNTDRIDYIDSTTNSDWSYHLTGYPNLRICPLIDSDHSQCCGGEVESCGGFDHWPVKVTIHSVDYNTMQLAGEMEAFDVPDRTVPESKSSITTYLEGEIIDLRQHSLETKSFPSSPQIDAVYWHKLLPFRSQSDSDLAQSLLSKKWLTEHISEEWILMRWKGGLSRPVPLSTTTSCCLLLLSLWWLSSNELFPVIF
jgi:hypothetical protein